MRSLNTAQDKAEFCEAVAEVLEKNGHCKGVYVNDQGQFCLLGAGYKALQTDIQAYKGHFSDAIAHVMGFASPGRLTSFNDGEEHIVTKKIPILNEVTTIWGEDGMATIEPNMDFVVHETMVYTGGLDKDSAIDYAMQRAKYWREQG